MNKKKKIILTILLGPTLYLILGLLNNFFGGYDPYFNGDGSKVYSKTGMLAHDSIIWQPRFGYYYNQYRNDTLGNVFYPFIVFNQNYINKTHSVFDEDFGEWWQSVTVEDIHPNYKAAYLGSKKENGE